MIFRALQAVKLLTRIRQERPDLWKQIQEFARKKAGGQPMKVGSLFSGIGGFDEGCRRAGMEVSWQVELEPFCQKVLATRFPTAQRHSDIRTCRGLTSSVPASPARIGRSRARERDCLERAARSFTSLQESCTHFDPLGSSSKMFPDFSVVTTDETLRKSSGFSWSSAGMGFNGVCLTASFSESPNAAVVCSLSDALESHVPQRFFLNPRAAQGILRRAKKRGRELPPRLQAALESLATRRDEGGKMTTTSPSQKISAEKSEPVQSALNSVALEESREVDTQPSQLPPRCESATAIMEEAARTETDQTISYWDDSQQTDTLDCSMLAKGQMMPEKRRFPCVLTPEESDKGTTQPTASRTCAEERGTKPTTDKASESGQTGQCTPLEPSNGTPYLAATLSTKNEPANSAATREEMMDTMATLTMSVRRLTPTECNRLQGFPDDWTCPTERQP